MHLATLESHSEQRGWLTSYQSIKIEILNISSRLNVEWMQHKITNMNSTTFKNLTLTEQMLSGELWQESAKKPSGFDQRHSRRHPTPSAHRTIKTPMIHVIQNVHLFSKLPPLIVSAYCVESFELYPFDIWNAWMPQCMFLFSIIPGHIVHFLTVVSSVNPINISILLRPGVKLCFA